MRTSIVTVSVTLAALLAATYILSLGCTRPADQPPPPAVQQLMERIKTGYNTQDTALLCGDFDDVMFTNGFTKEKFAEINQALLQKLGTWDSEVYMGEDNGVHTWNGTFSQGSAKIVIVIDGQNKVTGLWFR